MELLDTIGRGRSAPKEKMHSLRIPYWEDLTLNQKLNVLKAGGVEDAARYPRRAV